MTTNNDLNEEQSGLKITPIRIYKVNSGQIILGCNEFDEVSIVVSNVDNLIEAKEKAIQFLEHLKVHGFNFSE
jgi:hypothetical protein